MTENIKELIIKEAYKHFHVYGFKKTPIDQISSNLGISKKTLYKHFHSKELLIKAVIEQIIAPLNKEIDSVLEKKSSISETANVLFNVIQKISVEVSRPMVDDMRTLPRAWNLIEEKRRKALEKFAIILERDQAEGIVRDDLDVNLLVRILINT